jgi:glycogen debranching enzyme
VVLEPEDPHHIVATSSLSLSGARVLKHADTFAVFDRFGDITPRSAGEAEGIYHDGTRHLSRMRVSLAGERMLLLSSSVRDDNLLLAVDSMSPDLAPNGESPIAHGALHLLRTAFLWEGTCYQQLVLSNFGPTEIQVDLRIELFADFADVFEVRGTSRTARGVIHEPQLVSDGTLLSYTGLDRVRRRTRVAFFPAPDRSDVDGVSFFVRLASKESKSLTLTIACQSGEVPDVPRPPFDAAYAQATAILAGRDREDASVSTANEQFNDWVKRSIADLRMMITETPEGPFPYAGVPWFSTPFGRDALITALQVLWHCPDLARGVLFFLAGTQAAETNAARDAEPGKIIHEIRRGEMADLGEVPFGRYYGSVDATPLFVMLADAYYAHTGDHETILRLLPQLELALAWIDQHGDLDGDGFVEYGRRSKEGLIQQGWKDSYDSVFHADGGLAEGPIALAEVQAYVYGARAGAARLATALGLAGRAEVETAKAEALKAAFDRAFWSDQLGSYALALDRHKRPCLVKSSNAGQCLFTGIALPERARLIADQLLSPEMFSGWGVRTLACGEQRYNPISYHNGSVWPHDNALIGAGLARYGYKEHTAKILEGLFDASLFVDLHRLPELMCGFGRRPGEGPTLYPVACAPQAWASAAPLILVSSVLGMSIEGRNGRVRFDHPMLPAFLEHVTIKNLRVGRARVHLTFKRHPEDVGIIVLGRTGAVEIVSVK